MFFLLPLYKLVQVYFHIFSLLLFSVAHYLSARYVQLEQDGDPDLKLDDFTKLERHGFHILAQVDHLLFFLITKEQKFTLSMYFTI